MAVEDAGTISAKIRLELDQMERDGLQAQKMMDFYAKEFQKKGQEGGKMYVKGFGKSQLEMNNKLNEMVSSFRAISPKMGGFGEKLASVFSKPIFNMIPALSSAFTTMLPVIGGVIAGVGLLFKAISAAAKAQKEFNDNIKLSEKVSQELKGSTIEMSEAQRVSAELDQEMLENASASMLANKKISDFFGGIFDSIGNAMKSCVAEVGSFGSWVLDKIGLVTEAEAKAAAEAQKLKVVNEELAKATANYRNELKNLEAIEKAGAVSAEEAAGTRISSIESYIESLVSMRTAAEAMAGADSQRVKDIDEAIKRLLGEKDAIAKKTAETASLKEAEEALDAAVKARVTTEKTIEAAVAQGRITQEQANTQLLSAYSAEANALQSLQILASERMASDDEGWRRQISLQHQVNAALDEAIAKERELQAVTAQKSSSTIMTEQQFLDERKRIFDEFANLVNFQKELLAAEAVDEVEYNKRILQARQSQIAALENLMQRVGATSEEYKVTFELLEASIAGAGDDISAAAANIIGSTGSIELSLNGLRRQANDSALLEQIEAWNRELETVGMNTMRVAEVEHNRFLQNIADQVRAGDISEAVAEQAIEARQSLFNRQSIQGILDGMSEWQMKLEDLNATDIEGINIERRRALAEAGALNDGSDGYALLLSDINEYYDTLEETAAFDKFKTNAQEAFQATSQLIGQVGQALTAIMRRQTEEQIAELEKRRDAQFEIWDEEIQQRLYNMGLAEAASTEQYAKDLEEAKLTGDQRSIFEADEALRKYQVEQEYAAKKEELEKQVARTKAEEEYKAALSSWYIQMAQSAVNVAQSITMAAINLWPAVSLPMMALAGTLGAAQIATVAASRPVKRFATGGIVPGNSYSGDKVLGALNSREMVLNMDAQKNLFGAINDGNLGGGGLVNIELYLDSNLIAKDVVQMINDRRYIIKQASVV